MIVMDHRPEVRVHVSASRLVQGCLEDRQEDAHFLRKGVRALREADLQDRPYLGKSRPGLKTQPFLQQLESEYPRPCLAGPTSLMPLHERFLSENATIPTKGTP